MTKYDETINKRQGDIKAEILKFAEEMPIEFYICKKVGISRSTLYRWFEDDKSFKIKFKDARRMGISLVSDMAESNFIRKIKNGDQRASEFWVKHHEPDYAPHWDTRGNFKLSHELDTHETFQRHLEPNSQL